VDRRRIPNNYRRPLLATATATIVLIVVASLLEGSHAALNSVFAIVSVILAITCLGLLVLALRAR
jgi:hypothetical protein